LFIISCGVYNQEPLATFISLP